MPVPVSTSIQSFTQGWLGQFSSNPTLDGYGNPVVAGAQYYNTATNNIMIYGGTSWTVYNPNIAVTATTAATLAQTYASQAAISSASSSQSATNAAASASSASSAETSAAASASAAEAAAAAAELVENAINGIITIPLTNSNVNLTLTQFNNGIIVFTGAITANLTVLVPVQSHTFIAANSTSGSFTLTIGMIGGTFNVQVPQGKANSLYCDGSSGVYATSSVSGLQFSGVEQITVTGANITSANAGSRTVLATAGMITTLPPGSTLQPGAAIYFDNQTSGTQTIRTFGSDPIDIGTPLTMNGYDKFLFSWDGSEWRTALYSNYLNPIFSQGLGLASGFITVTNISTGAGLKIIGTGGTSPNKTISSVGGALQVLNSAGSTAILSLTDVGALSIANNLTFSNTGSLITGDFSNASIANRVAFQSSTINANSFISTIPNGSGTTSAFKAYNNSVPTNSASMSMFAAPSSVSLNSEMNGSGTLLPMTFQMAGTEYFRMNTTGNVLIGTTLDDASSLLQVNGQLHLVATGKGIEFPDGTKQITANGTTAPVSTLYTPAAGTTSITTGGYTPSFIQVYQNGVKLVNGSDFTATDSVHVVLTNPSGSGDTFEILTAVIYSPQTAMTPSDTVYILTAGTTTFSVSNYTVGFVDVFLNGSKLVGGQDYSATTGNSITLIGFSAEATDQFDVKIWSTYTPANALSGNNPTLLSGSLTFADGSQQASAAMGRNRIINGNCNVAQRGSVAYTTGINGYGGPDRFFATNNGAGGQFTQSQGSITYNGVVKNAVVQTVNTVPSSISGSNYWNGIQQRIEGYNCYDLLGQSITISFIFYTNVSGTYSIALEDNGGTNSYVTTFSAIANTSQKIVVTMTLPITLNIPNSNLSGLFLIIGALNTGTFATSTVGSWQSGNFSAAVGATNWGATIGNFISLTELQLESGIASTPFERESYSITLQKCQRYFWLLPAPSVDFQGMHTNTTAGFVFGLFYPVPMRSQPSASIAGSWIWTNSGGTGGTVTANAQSLTQFYFGITGTATAASAYSSGYLSTGPGATASFSAEL